MKDDQPSSISRSCKSVLHSKSKDESLVYIYKILLFLKSHSKLLNLISCSFNQLSQAKMAFNYVYRQANFAKWEPWHGKFGFYYPWNKYLQVGELLRELATMVLSLKGSLQSPRQVHIYICNIKFWFLFLLQTKKFIAGFG